ncbi:MAG: DUF488 domain-containing protein [Phycisphaeraceae bacterium]|nr:DUF488 domain-containing protein [Phycisphaeraceae bacterium]
MFLGLLKQHKVTAIVDVRSQPFSRLPEYNRDALAAGLKRVGIEYVPLGRELGARRDEPECYVDGRADYERIAQLSRFREGIERLLKGVERFAIALMCAEKEPLDCHRTVLVCRRLRPYGLHIRHILADGTLEEHADAEKRLVKMMDIAPDLFQPDVTEADLIERAYEERGKQIAFRMDAVGA